MNNQQNKLKVITLFTGIGAQEAALRRLGLDYEVVGISEIDKYAIQSYEAINGPTFNYGDITKIPMLDYADLWTYSFPCQDLSVAGKQAGISEGTRSGLLLHVERLLETAVLLGNQPKYLILENVKALVSKKFKPDFDRWLSKLDSLGYNNYWQVLNAKDYGVPQNRERVFVVSIRKDVDVLGYRFPDKIPLTRKLKDVLEPVVDEKYYLSQDKVDKLVMNMDKEISNTIRVGGGGSTDGKHTWDMVKVEQHGVNLSNQGTNFDKLTDVSNTLMARDYKGLGNQSMTAVIEPLACASRGRNPDNPNDRTAGIQLEQRLEINNTGCSNTLTTVEKDNYIIQENINIYPNSGNPQAGRVYNPKGISPALDTCQGGNRMPKILSMFNPYNHSEITDVAPTQTSQCDHKTTSSTVLVRYNNYRIRKLTPLECWRLMDFTDDEFYLAKFSGVSNSQLYKQAGNSICVCVLQAIFKELLA